MRRGLYTDYDKYTASGLRLVPIKHDAHPSEGGLSLAA